MKKCSFIFALLLLTEINVHAELAAEPFGQVKTLPVPYGVPTLAYHKK